MILSREPRIHPVPLLDLRPTQLTVGEREVEAKRRAWRDHPDRDKSDFLGRHLIPVVCGPKQQYYIIDHHHLALALHREGVREVAVTVVADVRALPRYAFWVFLDNRGWLHPFDVTGKRRSYAHLPRRITDLVDDPYRSLAGELRLRGGFAKDTTPFSEFLWADYLRRRIGQRVVTRHFGRALARALRLAKADEAGYLPGWCGPSDR
ncbi:MAG TPA: ParB-like protein [Steroidobacteraceae bacterium]|nr:ParB-like protein [Steroidobacteraceae bacterium]